MLLQLVYVSSAVRPFSASDLVELLDSSRRNNAKSSITGLLLYVGGNFMQALEGEEPAVEALYRVIEQDPRHRLVTVVMRATSDRRLFPHWAMGFKEKAEVSPDCQSAISSFLDDAEQDIGPGDNATSPARFLLRNFALTMR